MGKNITVMNDSSRNGKKNNGKIPEEKESLIASSTEEFVKIKVQEWDKFEIPEYRELKKEEIDYYKGLIESILFLSNEPLPVSSIARQIHLDLTNTRILLDTLMDEYNEKNGGIVLREIAGGYRFSTNDRYAEELKRIFKSKSSEKLSRPLLETLAIICYRQPITLSEIEEIRGVNSRAMVSMLLQKNLIKPQGYKPVPGRPTLYVTTREFLLKFQLNSLADLPPIKDIKELPFDDLE